MTSTIETTVGMAAAVHRLAEQHERLAAFPPKPERSARQRDAVDRMLALGRAEREELMREHAGAIYAELTDGYRRSLRVRELVYAAAEAYPGLVPTRAEVRDEQSRHQRDQDGLQIEQGIFLRYVLDHPRAGHHLLHAMSQPRREALDLLDRLRRDDRVELDLVSVWREDNIGHVEIRNHRSLNAEDDRSTADLEIAVDLVLLDDRIEVGVLRGAPATHPKWAGRRVFGAGINLTDLYEGRISLVDFFVERELGVVSKMYRGHAIGSPDAAGAEERHEKPWIAAVDAFAIGGGCQFLLVMDRVIAEPGSYVNLPASREGLIPGCGNLRLLRFVGERTARQAIFHSRDIPCESAEGQQLVDEVVAPELMAEAVRRRAEELTSAGPDSLLSNRKAMRIATEPVDTFRRYVACYAQDQAYNIHSPALVRNLERTWLARSRRKNSQSTKD